MNESNYDENNKLIQKFIGEFVKSTSYMDKVDENFIVRLTIITHIYYTLRQHYKFIIADLEIHNLALFIPRLANYIHNLYDNAYYIINAPITDIMNNLLRDYKKSDDLGTYIDNKLKSIGV